MPRGRPHVVVGAVALLLWGRAARAQEAETAKLDYVTPETCPGESSFRNLVAARLGHDPFVAEARTTVAVTITKEPRRLFGRASIAKHGAPPAERTLTSEPERCEALVAAIATSVAIVLEVMAPKLEPADPPVVAPPVEPPTPAPIIIVAERDRPPTPPPHEVTPPKPGPTIVGLLGPIAAVGLAPTATAGLAIAASVRAGRLSVELGVQAQTTIADGRTSSGDRLNVDLLLATLGGCAHLGDFAACARMHAGAIQVTAPDVVRPRLDSSPFIAPAVQLTYTLPLGRRFGIRTAIEGGLPLVRRTFDVSDGPVWTLAPVFGDATIAALMRFQ